MLWRLPCGRQLGRTQQQLQRDAGGAASRVYAGRRPCSGTAHCDRRHPLNMPAMPAGEGGSRHAPAACQLQQAIPAAGAHSPVYVIFVPGFQPALTGTSSTSALATDLPCCSSNTCRVTWQRSQADTHLRLPKRFLANVLSLEVLTNSAYPCSHMPGRLYRPALPCTNEAPGTTGESICRIVTPSST